jgi:hypothetical protein
MLICAIQHRLRRDSASVTVGLIWQLRKARVYDLHPGTVHPSRMNFVTCTGRGATKHVKARTKVPDATRCVRDYPLWSGLWRIHSVRLSSALGPVHTSARWRSFRECRLLVQIERQLLNSYS